LLRIYGPQVGHLIDREKELQILRRLGRKNIGPRVLGTFLNGRFEEYFDARPLTPKELRMPETAKQIAKRMRELHDGIELLEEEREGGPMIFKNWDKWVDRCEQVTTWLDKEVESPQNEIKAATEPWRRRGYVCGVPWAVFRRAVENYRLWLIASCGGIDEIKRQLVFAHNDVCLFLIPRHGLILTLLDSIWQSAPDGTCLGITSSSSSKPPQAARCH
jgi:choline kinase